MTEGREPLWASSLADQPPRYDDVSVSWELEEEPKAPKAPKPPKEPRDRRLLPGLLIVLGVVFAFALAALTDGGTLAVDDLPSGWGDTPMICKTARIQDGGAAFEMFRCHAVGGGVLPPGVYRSPESQWTSDFTRRDARASEIRIGTDGEVHGWAAY